MRLDPQLKERLKKAYSQELAAQNERITIFSVCVLTSEEMSKILEQFPQFGGRTLSSVENKIDPKIIGGFVIQSGSQLIDLSIRNALHLLKKQLYESN